jgi:hypothetical protein
MPLKIIGGTQLLNLIHISDIIRGIELSMQLVGSQPVNEFVDLSARVCVSADL